MNALQIINTQAHYQVIDNLPSGVRQCRRCAVLIGRGHQAPAKSDPRICHWCENETSNQKEHKMSESRNLGITEERVAQWADWRREGKSYSWISEHDELGPTYPTIKAHLEKNGYTSDGDMVNGSAPTAPAVNLPEGWGEVEAGVLPPNSAAGKYAPVIKYIQSVITVNWARIETPPPGASSHLWDQLRKHIRGIELANRTVDNKKYLYFRLKE